MIARLRARWLALSDDDQVHAAGLLLCGALFLFHFGFHSWWYVEDAAISFSYARNAATGEGLVPWPGGPWVEGFSNPSWTLLLAFLRLLGISPFLAAKLLGAGLGLATLPLAWAWARRIGGEHAGRWPLAVPLFLAVSPQFVLFCAAGLENPLFTFLLALGALWIAEEATEGGPPRSALPWFLLAITRPEAPMYPAVAGLVAFAFAADRRGARTAWSWAWRWGLAFGVPFVIWHAVRIGVFAWEWPNTYYAKLADESRFQPLEWKKGWRYLRGWALDSGMGFLLPVYVLGQTGVRGLRGWAGLALSAVVMLLWIPGLWWPSQVIEALPAPYDPPWLVSLRVVAIGITVILAPGIGLGRTGEVGRVLAWMLAVTGLFFALYAGFDWVDGYRWVNLAIVPLLVLYGDGLRQIAGALAGPGRWRKAVVGLLLAAPLGTGISWSVYHVVAPEIGPYDVRRRVVYMQDVARRLDIQHPVQMEVDMGAHLWWSGFEIVDMAGLVDVPMAHHHWEKPFVEQYVFEERRPDFAHVHGFWASQTKMTTHPAWKEEYVEIPGVPAGRRKFHVGNHVNRRWFVQDAWDGPAGRELQFAGGPMLAGLDTPLPEAAPGGTLSVEIGWMRPTPTPRFRAWLFLAGPESLHAWELPPGYDWVDPTRWKEGEVVVGRHALPVPADLPPGTYDLGLVVVREGPRGGLLPPRRVPDGATLSDPRMARGEVRWPGAVQVRPRAEVEGLAEADLAAATEAATGGDCAGAEAIWARARRRLDPYGPWALSARDRLARPMARCYAAWADAVGGADAVGALEAGRQWDHRDPVLRGVAREVADDLVAAGDAAVATGDDQGAYDAWSGALRVDPSRTWVRRRTEAARDRILFGQKP